MRIRSLLACILLIWLPGCYLLKQGKGQLDLHFSQVPLTEAYEQESNQDYRNLLREVPRIKAFAETRLLLDQSDSYTGYYHTSRRGVSFVVTASHRDELKPYTWWFPIVGSVPYKGYFDPGDAAKLAGELEDQGYDVWVFAAPAYSTLGWFKDPVTTPMMRRGHYYLADTIIHEMTHETLFVPGEERFNEQLASFVGKTGALAYFREVQGYDETQMAALKKRVEKSRRFSAVVRGYLPRFESLYSRGLPLEETLRQREALFADMKSELSALFPHLSEKKLRFNNARLLQFRRYTPDSPVLQEIWSDSGKNWRRFWQLVRVYVKDMQEKKPHVSQKATRVVEKFLD